MSDRKNLIVDTSVLLYDPTSLKSFYGNDVILPIIVLEELDRFKDKKDQVGSSAREVNRFLDSLRKVGSLNHGVMIPGTDITVRVESGMGPLDQSFPLDRGDNRIMSTATFTRDNSPSTQTVVVTKDINLRVKCDSIGIKAEDYYSDIPKAVRDGSPCYSGQSQIDVTNGDVETYYKEGELSLIESGELLENELVVASCDIDPQKSFIAIHQGGKLVRPKVNLSSSGNVKPRSKEQTAALHYLTSKDIPLVSLTGIAGSGKTFLTLLAAIDGLHSKSYERVVITRSIEPVGRDLGFLPGTLDEKMAPWLMPIVDNFRSAYHDTTYFDTMRQKGHIEVSPVSYIRGRSFNNCFVIVDEAQNLTIHEIKTIVTRCGSGTKIVLLGDTDQIDTPYLDKFSNGLSIVIEKLKGKNLFAHIRLDRGERSPLATLASREL